MSQIHPKKRFSLTPSFPSKSVFFPTPKSRGFHGPHSVGSGLTGGQRLENLVLGRLSAGNPRTKWPEVYSWEHHINIYIYNILFIYTIYELYYIYCIYNIFPLPCWITRDRESHPKSFFKVNLHHLNGDLPFCLFGDYHVCRALKIT